MRKTIYYPRSIGKSDSTKRERGRDKSKSDSDHDTEIIEPPESLNNNQRQQSQHSSRNDLLKRFFPDILKAIGNKAIKESPPTLQELEGYLQQYVSDLEKASNNSNKDYRKWREGTFDPTNKNQSHNHGIITSGPGSNNQNPLSPPSLQTSPKYSSSSTTSTNTAFTNQQSRRFFGIDFRGTEMDGNNLPIVRELIKKGYLTEDSNRWINKKGFMKMGEQILVEIIKSLKADKLGMHETMFTGYGSIIQESSRRYEVGNEISNISINSTIRNFLDRVYSSGTGKGKNILNADNDDDDDDRKKIEFPLDITYEDIEIYDTLEEIQVSTVYCIDLSSTMKYASMYSDLSRIEASKRALWSLYILNKKFFPLDIIHTIGFGSVAARIEAIDIPFLKTFEPNADFLHYTNYQAAYRLAKRILKKDGVKNKRIVMITDGHPSACFINEKSEQDRIMRQRPYSHFYKPDPKRIGMQDSESNRTKFDIHENQTVYLCYRYRQIDQYIGEQTIMDAKRIKKDGIDIDTIMVSEEDTLLDFVNELAKSVDGKSIYINPRDIDKVLITDYLLNKKKMIKK